MEIYLSENIYINDNKMLIGLNAFYDIDAFATHERLSYGFEAKSAVLEFTANKYEGINSSGSEEFVLTGHDYKLSSQIPYLHWAKISATGYVWDGQDGKSDIEGSKYGTEMQLTKTFSLDVKYDDKDAEGLEDEYETNLTFNWPPREGATALDGIASTAWNSEKNMREELGELNFTTIMRFILQRQAQLHLYNIPMTGHFVDYRGSMINWSPIGRNATEIDRERFQQFDRRDSSFRMDEVKGFKK